MISKKDVFKELPSIKDIENSQDNKFIWSSIYKCCYMIIRLLLDIRANQMRDL